MRRNWMKNTRKAMGFSQEEVASIVGISRSYYCQIESGTHTPSGSVALKIATFFGFDMSIFFSLRCCEYQHFEEVKIHDCQLNAVE